MTDLSPKESSTHHLMDSTGGLDGHTGAWIVVLDNGYELDQLAYAVRPHRGPFSTGAWDGGGLHQRSQAAGRGKHGVCPHRACLWTDAGHDPCGQPALADPGGSLADWDRSDGIGTGDR